MQDTTQEARVAGNPYIPTIYATHFAVQASAGVFTLVFYDARQGADGPVAQEVSRVAVPAGAALELARTIQQTGSAMALSASPPEGSA